MRKGVTIYAVVQRRPIKEIACDAMYLIIVTASVTILIIARPLHSSNE